MAKGYKIFSRSKKFRDNWDETFSKKPKWNPKLGPQADFINKKTEKAPWEDNMLGIVC